jgi:hypothetical protein
MSEKHHVIVKDDSYWYAQAKKLSRQLERLEAALAWVRTELDTYASCAEGTCAECDNLYRILRGIRPERIGAHKHSGERVADAQTEDHNA